LEQLQPTQIVPSFCLQYVLDDGTATLEVLATADVHRDILQVPVTDFEKYTEPVAKEIIDRIKAKEFLFSVSKVTALLCSTDIVSAS
jgi:hypothetical protein